MWTTLRRSALCFGHGGATVLAGNGRCLHADLPTCAFRPTISRVRSESSFEGPTTDRGDAGNGTGRAHDPTIQQPCCARFLHYQQLRPSQKNLVIMHIRGPTLLGSTRQSGAQIERDSEPVKTARQGPAHHRGQGHFDRSEPCLAPLRNHRHEQPLDTHIGIFPRVSNISELPDVSDFSATRPCVHGNQRNNDRPDHIVGSSSSRGRGTDRQRQSEAYLPRLSVSRGPDRAAQGRISAGIAWRNGRSC